MGYNSNSAIRNYGVNNNILDAAIASDLGPNLKSQKVEDTFFPNNVNGKLHNWVEYVAYDLYYLSGGEQIPIGTYYAPIIWSADTPLKDVNGQLQPDTSDPSNRIPFDPGALLSDPQIYDAQGHPLQTVSMASGSYLDFVNALQAGADFYAYQVSLMNGDDLITVGSTNTEPVEVGAGGTATITGGSNTPVWIWHDKNIVWTTTGTNNALVFDGQQGTNIETSGILFLNLATGSGINPWGGTLSVQGVNQVAAGIIGGEYIIANNNGDTIKSGFDAFGFAGNALIVGGTGNDTITGSGVGFGGSVTNVIVAGTGHDTLTGGINSFGDARTVTNIYSYNLGVDTITNFRAGAASGDIIDLSSVPGVSSFAGLSLTQVGANTVINFGGGHTITLDNVTKTALKAGNFLFAPEAAYAFTQTGEADFN